MCYKVPRQEPRICDYGNVGMYLGVRTGINSASLGKGYKCRNGKMGRIVQWVSMGPKSSEVRVFWNPPCFELKMPQSPWGWRYNNVRNGNVIHDHEWLSLCRVKQWDLKFISLTSLSIPSVNHIHSPIFACIQCIIYAFIRYLYHGAVSEGKLKDKFIDDFANNDFLALCAKLFGFLSSLAIMKTSSLWT